MFGEFICYFGPMYNHSKSFLPYGPVCSDTYSTQENSSKTSCVLSRARKGIVAMELVYSSSSPISMIVGNFRPQVSYSWSLSSEVKESEAELQLY